MLKASVAVESLIVFFVILCSLFIAIPIINDNNNKEKIIVKWVQKYSNLIYAFDTLRAQSESVSDRNVNEYEYKLKKILRVKNNIDISLYNPSFMNPRAKNDFYVFDKFFENENNIIMGIKNINTNCKNKELCAIMLVDINGIKKPNIWGLDIFGINIYENEIYPAGYELSIKEMRKDCSKYGTGVACSAYYLLGGLFVK